MRNIIRPIIFLGLIVMCLIVMITCIKVEKVVMVSTGNVNNVQANTATAEGTVVDIGEGITQHGHIYGPNPGVTMGGGNGETRLGAKSSTGSFSSELSNLNAGTTYYIRAYVTGNGGTKLGKEISFKTIDPEVPSLTTNIMTDVTSTSATSGGNITSDGGAPVTERGVCWSTTAGPTTDNSKTTDGTDTGNYSSFLTGLTPGTTYFLRAYATNITGTAYGNELSFTTNSEVPTLTTAVVTSITQTSAKSGGNITSNGGATVTASGVCWSINPSPDITGSHTTDGSTTGIFTSTITGLTPGTPYYVRAYATNSAGTGYGQEETFVTTDITLVTGSFTDSRDGNSYNWVQIGTQKWMAENLAYLPRVSKSNESSYFDPHYYVYDFQYNDVTVAKTTSNYQTYGVLYNWNAAMAGANSNDLNTLVLQGVCPTGWHLPSDSEWKKLEMFLGMTQTEADQTGQRGDIGGSLKEEGTTHWSSPNTGATNSSGFTALPGGMRNTDNSFYGLIYQGEWWTTTEYSAVLAYARLIDYAFRSVYRTYPNKDQGLSVRCVEGQGILLPVVETSTTISSITSTGVTTGGNVTGNGGSPVTARGVCWSTDHNISLGNGKETVDGSGIGIFTSTLTGLTSNTTYYVRAYATNSAGTAYGSEVSFTTSPPATLPTVTTASASGITASSAFGGGDVQDDGGAAVIAKGVCWSTSFGPTVNNTKTADGTGLGTFSSNINGLNPGTTYYVKAYATNSVGTSYGNEINFTTATTAPGAPTIGTATAGNTQATVSFTPPAGDGGSAIVIYTVTSSPGNLFATGSASPITVTGLVNGTAYTFTVTATSAIATSAPSAASNSVTPSTIPGAPTIGTATKGDAQATVAFTAPVSDGAAAITGYTVTSNPEGHTGTGSVSPIIVTGLANGTAYTFTVTATNANGTSLASTASNSVIPSSVPDAPIIGTATAGDTQATVTFTAPLDDGGSAITLYTATSSTGGKTGSGITSTITVTGLTNGTVYTFTVTATNDNGVSAPSTASNSVVPLPPGTVFSPATGRIWMDRNLGTSQVALNSTDANSYGDLYQWGRASDGHQLRTSTTTPTLSATDYPGNSYFITAPISPFDWREPQNDNLWQGVSGVNNPCPTGFRIPTDAELDAERASWSSNNAAGAYASPLKLPVAGLHDSGGGSLFGVGSVGYYWSSTVDGTNSRSLYFYSGDAIIGSYWRADGFSVRCIKD
ncbi:MAG TPA: FISUMP domain-containing protein [Bacteroidales bacterium]|nr:FISUMP domain-containing protein [Bacteroidales bacterium]